MHGKAENLKVLNEAIKMAKDYDTATAWHRVQDQRRS